MHNVLTLESRLAISGESNACTHTHTHTDGCNNNKYNFFILYNHPFGFFRECHSITLVIIEIVDTIREKLDKGNSVIATCLDLTVNFKILLYKMNLLWN